jgi:hypothetical protein
MGQDESLLFPQRGIKMTVEGKAVPKNELILYLPAVQAVEMALGRKILQNFLLHPDKVSPNIRGLDFQTLYIPEIPDRRDLVGMMNFQMGKYKRPLHSRTNFWSQEGYLEQIVFLQNRRVHSQTFGREPYRGNPSSFSISPVVHLARGLDDMPPADWL